MKKKDLILLMSSYWFSALWAVALSRELRFPPGNTKVSRNGKNEHKVLAGIAISSKRDSWTPKEDHDKYDEENFLHNPINHELTN